MGLGRSRGVHQVSVRRRRVGVSQVLSNRRIEHDRLLQDRAYLSPQGLESYILNVMTVDLDGP